MPDKKLIDVEVLKKVRQEMDEKNEAKFLNKDGSSESARVGNLIPDMNREFPNNFVFGTGEVDTTDGKARAVSVRGHTEWNGTTPSYVNVVSNKSVIFNLYNPSLHYAHVVESDDENNGLCIFGEDLAVGSVMEFSETSDFADITEIELSEATNSINETYLHCDVPSDGFIRVKNAEPSDLCISNVWGGYRVHQHPAYKEDNITIGSASYFASGLKSIHVGDKEVCYDEMYANKYYERVKDYSFGATPSVSYVNASGTYNIYRMSLSSALNKGACEIGGSTKFAFSDVGQMGSSTPLSADTMSLYTGYIYFAIAQSEDTTYTYTEDSDVVDSASFETELADKGHLFKLVDDAYVEATEYEADTTYYYISATNLHGLNGQAIVDEIKNKVINYQIKSMDKSVYTGTTISPAKEWEYDCGDFGTEELTLAEGFTVTPVWVVSYPINIKEEVQRLPENYVSKQSAEDMLHQVGELQGFDFDSIDYDNSTGKLKVNGLVDTKETIIYLNTRFTVNGAWTDITDAHDIAVLSKNYSNKERQEIQVIQLTLYPTDNWDKNLITTSSIQFGQGSMSVASKISAVQILWSEPYGRGFTIRFRLSGSKVQYYRG